MVILILGKTCSGKDTVAHYIADRYGFKRIVTYTTRPMRVDDIQGVSHHFISQEERSSYKEEDIFSPTAIDGYDYFMLKSQFSDDVVCIVDPKGVSDVRDLGVEFRAIYVDCPEKLILSRAKSRGTDVGVVKSRLDSERSVFEAFRDSGDYDYLLNNINSVINLQARVDVCMVMMGYKEADANGTVTKIEETS